MTVGLIGGINYALTLVPVGVLLLYYSARKIKEECERGIYDAPEHLLVMIAGALVMLSMFIPPLLKQFKNKGAPKIEVERIMKR